MDRSSVLTRPGRPSTDAALLMDARAEVEAVHVRNYDHRAGHSVRVAVARKGDDCLSERHYLAPGQSGRVSGQLAAGEYELRVWVDGVERERRTCYLDDTLDGTAVVELGNGVVSLTAGATAVSATD